MASARDVTTKSGNTVLALVGACLVGVATFLYTATHQPGPVSSVPVEKLSAAKPVKPTISRDVQRAVFYDNKVEPRILEADALNREAAERCIKRIRQMMNQYRGGIDPFVNDLTSMSTRFGIVKRMPAAWWKEDKRVEAYVEEKFERYLFSEEKLMNDITGVLDDFKSDIDTNQKRMLISVKAALGTADLPEVHADEYQPFFEAVSKQLQRYAASQGTASVQSAVGVFIVSETAATFAGRAIVVGLLARFGSTAVVSSVAGAGATAGTTAAGTGTGAFGGPVGAAVGFGVGMAVGLVIDWWMTEKFEAQMSKQMNKYLDTLESTILYGGATQHESPSEPIRANADESGLVDALPVVCDRLSEAYRERFYEQIVTGAPTP